MNFKSISYYLKIILLLNIVSMPKNQLFKNIPDLQIVQSVLEAFGLDNIEDTRLFTKEHMQDVETVQKITELIPTVPEPKAYSIKLKLLTPFSIESFTKLI